MGCTINIVNKIFCFAVTVYNISVQKYDYNVNTSITDCY